MTQSKPIYFPGLNGLRAFSAIAVVCSHILLGLDNFNLDPAVFGVLIGDTHRGLDMAGSGVSIFFVISGFLITYLLQVEKDLKGIDIKKFYVRRILRIWPLYYLYLGLALITIFCYKLPFNWGILFFYLFYMANVPDMFDVPMRLMAHYWSLGVEEQFYMVWPWFNKKFGTNIIPIILFLIGTTVMLKLITHFLFPPGLFAIIIDNIRYHVMMVGALGALLYKQGNKIFLKIADNIVTQCICWFVIFLLMINRFHIASIIDNEIISVVALMLIIGQIRIKNRVVNLEKPIFDFLGKISYGIYVIHPILIFYSAKLLKDLNIPAPLKYFTVFATVLGATIFLAYLSYNYFEKYFLNFKKKFVVVNSSSTNTELEA